MTSDGERNVHDSRRTLDKEEVDREKIDNIEEETSEIYINDISKNISKVTISCNSIYSNYSESNMCTNIELKASHAQYKVLKRNKKQ